MGNRQRIKGETIQWAIDKGQTIQWAIDKGQTIPWTDNTMDRQYYGQTIKWTDNAMGNRQSTDNTMGNRQRIKGQTIQWAIDKG